MPSGPERTVSARRLRPCLSSILPFGHLRLVNEHHRNAVSDRIPSAALKANYPSFSLDNVAPASRAAHDFQEFLVNHFASPRFSLLRGVQTAIRGFRRRMCRTSEGAFGKPHGAAFDWGTGLAGAFPFSSHQITPPTAPIASHSSRIIRANANTTER